MSVSTYQRRILNGYRAAAALMADARALHRAVGNTDESLAAYRTSATVTAAARNLDRMGGWIAHRDEHAECRPRSVAISLPLRDM